MHSIVICNFINFVLYPNLLFPNSISIYAIQKVQSNSYN